MKVAEPIAVPAEQAAPDVLAWHKAELGRLPFLRLGLTAHYEGSIDKAGGNADWDWWLYQDARGEWVLLDVEGPGCVHHFVQHRYPTCPEPVFRFYFDGEAEPRYTMRPADFGRKAPFLKPVADVFEGDDVPPRGRGPIWVVRSMLPMAFEKGCRITSSVKLEGCDRAKGEGGWGHVIYHRYAEYPEVWEEPAGGAVRQVCGATIPAGGGHTVFAHQGPASVRSLRLRVPPGVLHDLWVRLEWDGEEHPAAWCPIGAFFGNEFGAHRIGFLTHGQEADGTYYCRFPMPFWKSGKITLCNRHSSEAMTVECEVLVDAPYPEAACGYFRAAEYCEPREVTPGRDSVIGEARGRGHVVAATLTGRAVDGRYVSCEGDVRLHLDGCGTPQIESDGSESHAGYGWGFVYPPQENPFSGYDGSGDPLCEFSETRVHVADVIPFRDGFRFGLEAGDCNDAPMRHSGLILYYGRAELGMELTDTVDLGDSASENSHAYLVEGEVWRGELSARYEDESSAPLINRGVAHRGASEFSVAIKAGNAGVRLRRRSDQLHGRQRARVFVDGERVAEYDWYVADRNPHRRWLEEEFEIPLRYTRGKDRIRIRLEHLGEAPAWTEFFYWVFSHTA